LQGEQRNATVNFDMHRVVSLPEHGDPAQAYISDRSNAEITQSMLIFTASQ